MGALARDAQSQAHPSLLANLWCLEVLTLSPWVLLMRTPLLTLLLPPNPSLKDMNNTKSGTLCVPSLYGPLFFLFQDSGLTSLSLHPKYALPYQISGSINDLSRENRPGWKKNLKGFDFYCTGCSLCFGSQIRMWCFFSHHQNIGFQIDVGAAPLTEHLITCLQNFSSHLHSSELCRFGGHGHSSQETNASTRGHNCSSIELDVETAVGHWESSCHWTKRRKGLLYCLEWLIPITRRNWVVTWWR